jgi:signal transduction histidine kinase/DNA-binding response OmpR family regulator
MATYHPCVLFLTLLLFQYELAGQSSPFHSFDQFDRACGLTENVNMMRQDEHGLFWLATDNGLFRFDGVQAVKINYLTSDTLPKSASNIFALSCDTFRHCIWLATEWGIFKYHPGSGKSEHLRAQDLLPQEHLYKPTAHNIYNDRQGEIWSSFGVYGLTHLLEDGKKAEFFFLPLTQKETEHGVDWRLANSALAVRQDANRDEILWVTTRRGLLKFNKAERKLERYIYYPTDKAMFDLANAMPILYPHPNGKIYIGTWNAGLLVFDPAGQTFSHYFPTPEGWSATTDKNYIGSILPDAAGNLWMSGSFGLSHFDVATNRFSKPEPSKYLHFQDRQGNFWQYHSGLRLFHRLKNELPRRQGPPEDQCRRGVSDLPYDPETHRLYFRTYCQSGVYSLDVKQFTRQFHPLPGRQGEEVEFKAYAATPAGFLMSDEKYRLYLRPEGSGQFQRLPVVFPPDCGNLTISSRADGHIFIAGHVGYFFWFKPGSWTPAVFTKTTVGVSEPDHFSCATVGELDDRGRLWMRTCGGFSIFIPEEERFLHINKKTPNVSHLGDYYQFHLDEKNRMWAFNSTEFGWFDPRQPEAGIHQKFNLPYADIWFAFMENGKFRLTSKEGLVEFDPETHRSRLFEQITTRQIFNPGDGRFIALYDLEYSVGRLDSLRQNEETPQPYACSFRVFDKQRAIPGNPFSPDELRLAPSENFFTIGISALALFDPQKIRFAYQLEGVDKDWVKLEPDQRSVSYTSVAGGDYVFRIKSTNSRGEWVGKPYELKIHIGKPWYKTTLAKCIYLLLLTGSIYWFYQMRKRQWETAADLQAKTLEARRLADLDTFKTRFFTNITHEFRTPLTVILGITEQQRLELEKLESYQLKPEFGGTTISDLRPFIENSKAVARNGHQLLQLINQMLDLARLESGKFTLNERQSDVMAFVKINVEAFQSLAISKKQNLACLTDPAELLMDFDPQRLQQVLSNLLSNALKFTPEFGSVKLVARQVAATKCLQIVVEDTGPGIAAADLPLVFDRFFQVENAQNTSGTGIGLALAKELVQHMGGGILAESKVGIGSKFIVTLPIRNEAELVDFQTIEKPVSTYWEGELPAAAKVELPVLLHVEDHPDLLQYLQKLLGDYYRIVAARNGNEGLEKAFEIVPDIILSDVMMPGMSGFELCEKLKADARTSHIPIVLLTAKATVTDKIEGLQQGADAYLMKPFQQEELFATLRNLLENRRRMAAYLTRNDPAAEAPPGVAKEHEFLQKIRTIIDKNLSDETYDMTRLSRDLALSRMQIHRKLTALTGTSASHFVRSHRLEKARQLIESTELTIAEIAYATGFSDHAYFTKCFKEEFGKTPSDTRK